MTKVKLCLASSEVDVPSRQREWRLCGACMTDNQCSDVNINTTKTCPCFLFCFVFLKDVKEKVYM